MKLNLNNKYILIIEYNKNKEISNYITIKLAKEKCNIIGINLFIEEKIKKIFLKNKRLFINYKCKINNLDFIKKIFLVTKKIDLLINIINNNIYLFKNKNIVNLISNIVIKKFFITKMKGKIINITYNLNLYKDKNNYFIIKNNIKNIKILSKKWTKFNININTIILGYFINKNINYYIDPIEEQNITNKIPSIKWGNYNDLIGAIFFLGSNKSNYIYGNTLFIDGGYFLTKKYLLR